jgi:hypothetical protein
MDLKTETGYVRRVEPLASKRVLERRLVRYRETLGD